MERDKLKRIIETLLFVSEEPLALNTFKEIVEEEDGRLIRTLIDELDQEYKTAGRSFAVRSVAGGYQIYTYPECAPWVKKMLKPKKDARLSVPAMETLAIITYRQPITRSEIEFIRGVNVDGVVSTLLERGLIKTMGRKKVIGRPILYGTTKFFLKHFGLNNLDELPNWERFIEERGDKISPDKGERGDGGNDIEETADEDRQAGSQDIDASEPADQMRSGDREAQGKEE